ncbi:hypothetical protein SAMN04487967_2696 [Natronorubrum sediminis]|uniref:Helix-turn-helix domain-containing protein n=1 Tax=Natronorubrum sediminis TaxID=640943 RepID=A0A1H6G3G6_9EURY|nr:winged helix-turn-helix domain-containing protein [Natronorubrum sediminis]SEH16544.1 hypothetical protein SAMN04487967_2696 [Natronorubrum sediminis]
MTRDEGSDAGSGPQVREAFSLLNHEIRLEIVLALLEDWQAVYTEPRSYAELMEAVGMRDSGKFNYHLDKLRGVYVWQVEDGYVPTASVTALYRAVLAHQPTAEFEYDQTEIDAACPGCDATLVLEYERGFVSVDCSACDWIGFTYPFPRRGFDGRDADAVARAVTRRARHHVAMAAEGQCPFCAGTTTVDPRVDAVEDDEYWIKIDCDACSYTIGTAPLATVLYDGQVATALEEVGTGREPYDWQLPGATVRVESRDPLELALEIDGDDGTATVVVDDTVTVQSVCVDG